MRETLVFFGNQVQKHLVDDNPAPASADGNIGIPLRSGLGSTACLTIWGCKAQNNFQATRYSTLNSSRKPSIWT
ncbi:homoserine kinase [Pedobacter sp. W3I1]|nr:homoserine kinase [Pedobacter sp. W3I1]